MSNKVTLPGQQVSIDTPTGVDPIWYEKLRTITAFVNLFSEVNFATMTTGQTFRWDATQKKFIAGA